MLDKDAKIYVAGHQGMVGAAIHRKLEADGYHNLIVHSHADLDLSNQLAVREIMQSERPDHVVLAAAKVGGIHANNTYPADFIYQNLMIEVNAIHETYASGCKRLLFLGSSCIYPKEVAQPMRESALLTGILEETNEPYAIAKIAGIKMCESYNRQFGTDFRSAMPTNLYGPRDNFHPDNSHVIPALMRRIHEAKEHGTPDVVVWGTGQAKREFLYVDDMAAACLHIMNLTADEHAAHTQPMMSHINVGTGADITIRELVDAIVEVVGYKGEIRWDTSKPDGTARKLMDVSKLTELGWNASVGLRDGLASTYDWFLSHQDSFRQK